MYGYLTMVSDALIANAVRPAVHRRSGFTEVGGSSSAGRIAVVGREHGRAYSTFW
jgi:hypothetical protein